MSVTISVLHNSLPKIGGAFIGRVADANTKAAFDCLAAARPPVDTGALKNSGGVNPASGGDSTAVTYWSVEHAPYVEFGTSKMAAQPYARPAAEAVKPGWIAALSQAVEP